MKQPNPMTIDERIEGLVQSTELLLRSHEQTQNEIKDLIRETRRFQYWAEAIILNQGIPPAGAGQGTPRGAASMKTEKTQKRPTFHATCAEEKHQWQEKFL